MSILEVKDLIRPVSRDDALEDIIVLAQSMKLRARSWRIGSKSRFWIMALAEVASRVSVQVALQTAGGFNGTAWGNMLTKLSKSRFSNDQILAIKTQGGLLLTDVGGNGPYTIGVGAYVFTFEDDAGITYRNITGGTLPASGTLAITVEAETGGEASNVDIDKITAMNPTIAGVECTNPANPTDWITRTGVNKEPDSTLQTRNVAKWATLGGNAPAAAYEYWALSATDSLGDPVGLTRVFVDATNPRGPGTLDVYVADDTGTATPQQVSDVQDYLDLIPTEKKPVTADPLVIAADEEPVDIVGSFHVRAGHAADAAADILEALTAYINALPIGGTSLGGSGRVIFAELIAAVMDVDDVLSVSFTSPTADTILVPGDVAVLGTYTMTPVEV